MKEIMHRKKFSHRVKADTTRERAEALKPFADCINKHLQFGLVMALDVNGFNHLPKGMRAGLGDPKDPNYVAFLRAVLELFKYCKTDDHLAVVCDHDDETAPGFWGYYKGLRKHEDMREQIVSISFADDNYFLSLQAADMIAYITRLEARRQWYGDRHDYKGLLDHMVDKRSPGEGMQCQWGICFLNEERLRSLKSRHDVLAERRRAVS